MLFCNVGGKNHYANVFTKLFTTKIVANNLLGYFNSLNIFSIIYLINPLGVNEKKATSEAVNQKQKILIETLKLQS